MNLPAQLLTAILDSVKTGDRVIDIGAGLEAEYQSGAQLRASRLVLIDAHQPYLDANRTHGPNVERVCGLSPTGLTRYPNDSFDVALAIDHIEHLSKEDGVNLILQMQRIADTVLVFTPVGECPQDSDAYRMGADKWQTHRSAWTPEDLMTLGFQRCEVWNAVDEKWKIGAPNKAFLAVWHRPLTKGRILIVNEFDPAGVGLGHRKALRARGWDVRLASEFAYVPEQLGADWVGKRLVSEGNLTWWESLLVDRDSLVDFASRCDILQVCPGIIGTWADRHDVFPPREGIDAPRSKWFSVEDWTSIIPKSAAKVAFFHGSLSAWANRRQYKEWYSKLGYQLAASTLDYAVELDTAYLPPVMPKLTAVPLRTDDEPLRLIHAPTNPVINHTALFTSLCSDLGIHHRVVRGVSHSEVMRIKRESNAGFDHLRGSFSVNHLENCSLGLASLVALRSEYSLRLWDEGFTSLPSPLGSPIVSEDQLRSALTDLRDSPTLHRAQQRWCWEWAQQFNQEVIGDRLNRFYSEIKP